jgi:hypothetical protein
VEFQIEAQSIEFLRQRLAQLRSEHVPLPAYTMD